MTEIITHEGVNYRKVGRKAVVGDLVQYDVDCGTVGVSRVSSRQFETDDFYTEDGAYIWVGCGDKYSVLEEVVNMTKTLTEMPKVGDKVRYLGGDAEFDSDLTVGKLYIIVDTDYEDDAYFIDDVGDEWCLIEGDNFDFFELVTEPQPDVHALIANLGRRLSEVETALAPKLDVVDKPAQIRAVCDKVRDLLIRKNHDYGDSFAQQYEKYGLQSALIRMDDKMRRLETLTDGEQAQVSESIEDTLMDLAGYALLALVEAGEAE